MKAVVPDAESRSGRRARSGLFSKAKATVSKREAKPAAAALSGTKRKGFPEALIVLDGNFPLSSMLEGPQNRYR